MTAFLFPGQGTQRPGMGAGLFDRYSTLVAEADQLLGYSLKSLCLAPAEPRLHQTEFTQPAVYVTSYLRYRELSEKSAAARMLAGHSLGEYTALAAAGAFSFADGLRLVQKRGLLMGQSRGGGLVALIGLDPDAVSKLLTENRLSALEIANFNSPTQVVVGGAKNHLQDLIDLCATRAIRAVPLKVSGAFHTRYMKPAADAFATFIENLQISSPTFPVLSNVTGIVHNVSDIRERLVEQMYRPVRWSACAETMLAAGIENFIELGAPPVLTPLVAALKKYRGSLTANGAGCESKQLEVRTPRSSSGFCQTFSCDRPIIAGTLGKGLSSPPLVSALAKVGVLGFLDTEGLSLDQIDEAITSFPPELKGRFGLGVTANPEDPDADAAILELAVQRGVSKIEARGYTAPSTALRDYRQMRENRVIARVATYGAVSAFLGVMLDTAATGQSPKKMGDVEADAICIDFHGWRGTPAAPRQLLEDLFLWRKARGKGQLSVLIGATPAVMSSYSVEALRLLGTDFVCGSSAYLVARETGLDEATRGRLISGEGVFEELPDWTCPEFDTRSWMFVPEPRNVDASLQLYALYRHPRPTDRWESVTGNMPEPLRSMVRGAMATATPEVSMRELREILRQVGRSLPLSLAVPCDSPLAPMSASAFESAGSGRIGDLSVEQITEHLFSSSRVSANTEEVANA